MTPAPNGVYLARNGARGRTWRISPPSTPGAAHYVRTSHAVDQIEKLRAALTDIASGSAADPARVAWLALAAHGT